jgi:flagellar protein FliS
MQNKGVSMNHANIQTVLNEYKQVGVQNNVTDASPHRLVQMLMEGALDRISSAKGHMQRNRFTEKSRFISSAISIIDGLRSSLDFEKGGEIAENLDALYDYMNRRLLEANVNNNIEYLDEVHGLMCEIKIGWDGIAAEANKS